MNKNNQYKKAFLEEKDRIMKNSATRASDTIDAGGDESDLVQAAIIKNLSDQLSKREVNSLRQIGKCLSKIENGTFGYCEECEQEIGEKRLKAMPFALLCISCAEDQERLNKIG